MSFYGEYINRDSIVRIQFALKKFFETEFGGNLKDDCSWTMDQARELAEQYPEIWEKYRPKEDNRDDYRRDGCDRP